MELVQSFPEAGVEVYRRHDRTTRSVEDIKEGLRQAPDTRFVGRVLVDKQSGEPVVYTENLFVKFEDDNDRDHCLEVLREAGLTVKQELSYATNAFFVEPQKARASKCSTSPTSYWRAMMWNTATRNWCDGSDDGRLPHSNGTSKR